jgi:hypothetical protein
MWCAHCAVFFCSYEQNCVNSYAHASCTFHLHCSTPRGRTSSFVVSPALTRLKMCADGNRNEYLLYWGHKYQFHKNYTPLSTTLCTVALPQSRLATMNTMKPSPRHVQRIPLQSIHWAVFQQDLVFYNPTDHDKRVPIKLYYDFIPVYSYLIYLYIMHVNIIFLLIATSTSIFWPRGFEPKFYSYHILT